MKTQVWEMSKAGSLDRLQLVERNLTEPKIDEVKIEIKAIGLNFADIFACLGLYSATPEGAFVPGLEYSGVVLEAGKESRFKEGDKVMGLTRFGAYTTHLVIKADYVRMLPSQWSFTEGAAYLVQALTAYYAIYSLGALKADATVLVHSAAGGVGLQALAILEQAKATPIATIGSIAKKDLLITKGLSSEQIIVRDSKNFSQQLQSSLDFVGSSGFDLVLDAIAGPYFTPAMQCLNAAGRYVIFGAASFMNPGQRPNYVKLGFEYFRRPKLDVIEMISKNHSLMAFNLIWLWDRLDLMKELLDQMQSKGLEKQASFIGHTLNFKDAPKAMQLFQSGKTVGKVVLKC